MEVPAADNDNVVGYAPEPSAGLTTNTEPEADEDDVDWRN